MKKSIASLLLPVVLFILGAPLGRAQQPGQYDPAFTPAQIDLGVQQMVPLAGGKAVVAGRYLTINGAAVGPVVRFKADGTLDPDFANGNRGYIPSGDTQVNSIDVAVAPDGKIYVALGTSPSFSNLLVRLNADGTTDATFTATLDGAPSAMVVQPNGQVVIAGSFSTVNGVSVVGAVARLNLDGTTDNSFDTNPRAGAQAIQFTYAYELALQSDGKLLVGGVPSYTNSSVVARLNADGSLDTSFFINTVQDGSLDAFALQPDGNLVIGYNTDNLGGAPFPYAARLKTHTTDNTDGQVDETFQPNGAITAFPYNIVAQADGKLVFSVGTNVFRLNADGSADRTFTFGAPANSINVVVYAQTTDGNLLASGQVIIGNNYVPGIARLFGSVPGGAAAVSVVVPGTSNPWLARDGSTDQADLTPLQQPVRVADLALTPGASLTFTTYGAVDYSGGQPTDGAAGRTDYPVNHATENGVSGINAPLDGLVGVFIDDTAASGVASAPADLDFSTDSARDFATLAPALGQTFFIGYGQTSTGASQQFTVPAGAKHLVLGTVDGLGWYNNTGAFVVTIAPGTGTGGGGGGGGTSGALTIPGTADIWLAGQENGLFASKGADQAPAQSPVQVPNLTLDPSKGLLFNVGGLVTTDTTNTLRPPDGTDTLVTHATENGVSGATARVGALVGVFVSDDKPVAATAPSAQNYGNAGASNSFSPRLQQSFFIGDGKDTLARTQTFYPPKGATRLFLGVMDNTAFKDNNGSFSVGVTTSTVDPTDLSVGENVTSSSTPNGNGSFALIGDVLRYTFTVRNSGKSTLTHVVVSDAIPPYIDPAKIVTFDGFINNGIASWSVGDLAPGATATRTLQVTLTNAAPLGLHYTNKGYTATADGFPDVVGRDQPDTLIESAVSVTISNNSATARPGGTVRFIYDLSNTTPEAFKKLTLTVPFLEGLYFSKAYFADSNGIAKPVDTTGKNVAAYNQQTNSAVFTLNSLKGGAEMFLVLEATVATNFNPTGLVNLPGAQIVISKFTNGQPITLSLDDSASALSGLPAEAAPKLSFGKSVVTGDLAAVILAANPNAVLLLNSVTLKPFLDLNPNQKAIQKLGTFTSLATLTPDQISQVLNPFIGSDTDADTGASVSTVAAPSAKAPNPFVTFGLAYVNTGAGTAKEIVVSDSAPKGLEIDRDSFFVNGVATPQSAIQFNDDGSFAVTAKNLKTNKGGLIIYRARVLAPVPAPNGVDLGGYIEPPSAQLTLAYLNDEVIAPAPAKILLTGPAHASVSSTQTGDTTTGGNVTYTILYRNDGGQTITDFRVVSPVPPGGSFQSARFLGLDQQGRTPNGAKGESLAAPGVGATSGLTVFHLGKVKTRGFGLVQVVYQMTSAVLQQPSQAMVHQPYVAATGGLPATNALPAGSPLRRESRPIVTRDAGDADVGATGAPNTSHVVGNPNGPHLGMTVACSQAVTANETLGYTVTAISLGDTGLPNLFGFSFGDPLIAFFVPVPDGTEYAGVTGGVTANVTVNATVQTGTTGIKYVTGYLPNLPNQGASYVTVSFRALGSAKSVIQNPDIILYDVLSGTTLHSGPINTTVLSPTDYFNLQRLVLLDTLSSTGTTTFTGANFQQRVDQVTSKSRFTAVINADYLSLDNGVLVIPTSGGNIVAQGGGNVINTNGSNIVAQGGGNIVAQGGGNIVAQGGGNIVAQGGGNLITIKNLVDSKGQLISQDGNSVSNIFAGIVAQGGGNIVAQGGGNIVAQGGGNIVAQGGGNLQSVGVKVISNDGGSFAASADKALAISQADLASFGQASSLSGEVFRSESGNATLTGSGFAAAVAGGGIKIDSLVRGSTDNLALTHITSQADVVRGGSGLIGNAGGTLKGNVGGTISLERGGSQPR